MTLVGTEVLLTQFHRMISWRSRLNMTTLPFSDSRLASNILSSQLSLAPSGSTLDLPCKPIFGPFAHKQMILVWNKCIVFMRLRCIVFQLTTMMPPNMRRYTCKSKNGIEDIRSSKVGDNSTSNFIKWKHVHWLFSLSHRFTFFYTCI